MARKNKTNKEGKSMKQFLRQLAVGIGAIFLIIFAIFLLRWISSFFIWVTDLIKIEEAIQNLTWIILGMVLLVLVQGLGALVIYFFAPHAENRRAKRRKIQNNDGTEISRREAGRRRRNEEYTVRKYAVLPEQYAEEKSARDDSAEEESVYSEEAYAE